MNIDKLVGVIAEKRFKKKDIAKQLGLSAKTFYNKLKKGVFGTDEVNKLVSILNLTHEEAINIFLPQK